MNNLIKLKELSNYLTETESTLSVFWMLNPALLCICKDGIFLEVNPASEKLLGYTQDELIGTKYIDLVHPEDKNKTKIVEDDLINLKKVNQFTNRYKHKNGSWVYLNWSAKLDHYSGNVYAVASDVTLEQTKNFRLRAALDFAPFGVFLTDTSGQCVYTNRKWKDLTGLTEEEALGDGWINGIAEENREELLKLWKSFAEAGQKNDKIHFSCNVSYHNKITKYKIPVRIVSYIYGDGEFIGYVDFCFTDFNQNEKTSNNYVR